MKKIKILFWVFTVLFAAFMFISAVPDILSVKEAADLFSKLKMPAYLLQFLGITKALGVIAILIPGYPRIKEWAYAGLVFDLLGATYSLAASGQPASDWGFMIVPLLLAAASYAFYHKKLKVAASATASDETTNYQFTNQTITTEAAA